MSQPVAINPRIIEALYCEALVLADEARTAFENAMRPVTDRDDEDLVRIALSCEALRTTTRMMHALAWLLNYRAYLNGELTEFQLLRQARLTQNYPGADAERLALLDAGTRELIGATERFYARLVRIERGWRDGSGNMPTAISRLEERLGISAAG